MIEFARIDGWGHGSVRLSFPNGELADVLASPGETTIGSASGNSVVLKCDGIRPHHATILSDARGITLFVSDPDASAHVNARPIKQLALLRLGDVVSLQSVNLVLKPDNDDAVRAPPESVFSEEQHNEAPGGDFIARGAPPRVVLRGVAGPYFGRAIPITERLTLGAGKDCDLVLDESDLGAKHAEIRVRPGLGIFMRDLGSKSGTTVNGLQVRDAVLFTGDQLSFQQNRFVLEAPGMPTRKDQPTLTSSTVSPKAASSETRPSASGPVLVTQTMKAIRPEDVQAAEAKQKATAAAKKTAELPLAPAKDASSPWLLIAIGVMIAVGIALLLMARGAG